MNSWKKSKILTKQMSVYSDLRYNLATFLSLQKIEDSIKSMNRGQSPRSDKYLFTGIRYKISSSSYGWYVSSSISGPLPETKPAINFRYYDMDNASCRLY